MTDREKLVELLENNPYLDVLDGDFEKSADWLIANGVTVKELQKPLTVEEFMRLPEVVYVECTFFVEIHAALPFGLKTIEVPCVGLQFAKGYEYFRMDKYGITWRLWANCPTDEERKAAEWE